jgi:hypothetical protein
MGFFKQVFLCFFFSKSKKSNKKPSSNTDDNLQFSSGFATYMRSRKPDLNSEGRKADTFRGNDLRQEHLENEMDEFYSTSDDD